MSQRENIKRLALLLQKVNTGYPSKEDLLEYMEELGFPCSPRTLERKLKEIREEFWVEVKYDRLQRGYYIEENEVTQANMLLKLFGLINTTDLLLSNLKDSKEALDYIVFDNADYYKGSEYIPELLNAIKSGKLIQFEHYNFYKSQTYGIDLKPLLLKEYEHRWYVIGYNDYVNDYRSYALDRVSNLQVSDKKFNTKSYKNVKDLFIHTVGLSFSVDKPQIVRIAYDKLQAEYVKSLPLHHSQEIESETDDELIMSYYVVPNFEFEQKIFMQMNGAKVLEPESFVKRIKETTKNILAKY